MFNSEFLRLNGIIIKYYDKYCSGKIHANRQADRRDKAEVVFLPDRQILYLDCKEFLEIWERAKRVSIIFDFFRKPAALAAG